MNSRIPALAKFARAGCFWAGGGLGLLACAGFWLYSRPDSSGTTGEAQRADALRLRHKADIEARQRATACDVEAVFPAQAQQMLKDTPKASPIR